MYIMVKTDTMNFNKKIVAMLFVIATFTIATAQNELFSDYIPVGIHAAMDNYFNGKVTGTPSDSPVKYTMAPFTQLSFGLNTIVYNKAKLSIKLGLRANLLEYKENLKIAPDQLLEHEFYLQDGTYMDRYGKYGIPISGEYILTKKKKNKLAALITLYPSYWLFERKRITRINSYQLFSYGYAIESNKYDRFYFDAQLGLAYYIPTKHLLIEPFIYYNMSFKNIWEGRYGIWGIQNRPYTEVTGIAKQSGNHIALGFNLYLKKAKKKR